MENVTGTTSNTRGIDQIYTPLDKSRCEIRLLRRKPGAPATPVHLEVAVFALNDEPKYSALSYCWTKEVPIFPILCNGIEHVVRRNLFSYLKSLAASSADSDDGWIFVDAICINQSDIPERSSQVVLMGRIYAEAREVVVWLGDEGVFWHLVAAPAPDDVLEQYSKASRLGISNPFEGMEETSCILFAMTFLRWQFWSRLWVLQEVLLSKRLVFRHKLFEVQSDHLLGFLDTLDLETESDEDSDMWDGGLGDVGTGYWWEMLRDRRPTFHAEGTKFAPVGCIVRNVLRTRHARPDQGPMLEIWRAVVRYANMETTEIRDHVFGLLGMVSSILRPDYKMPVLELYLRVLAEGFVELNPSYPSIFDDDSSGDEPAMLKSAMFLSALLSALGLRPDSPSVALITLEAFQVLISRSRIYYHYRDVYQFYHLLWSVDKKYKRKWKQSALPSAFEVHVKIKRRLSRMEAENMVVPGLPSPGDSKSYEECVMWCNDVITDVLDAVQHKSPPPTVAATQ